MVKKSSKKKVAKKVVKKKGRTKKTISWRAVNNLLKFGCLGTEIAAKLGMHPDTLYDRCLEENKVLFSDYSRQKGDIGKMELRKAQHRLALKGDKTMLVWLGKQKLNQKDKQEIEVSGSLAGLLQSARKRANG